jgi:protease I
MEMDLNSKRVLIFAGPDFEDRELFYPLYRFREAGAEVRVAGLGERTYKGKYGITADIDGPYEDYVGVRWDIIVIPGGWAPDKIRMNESALQIIKDAMKQGDIVASICHGGWVLASAGVVEGRTLTSYRAIRDDMISAGANWVDRDVVVDKNLVTSRMPSDLPAFCREIIRLAQRVPVGV